jgi:hypothetical protein
MSRNPQLEAIFEARYAWENAPPEERASRLGGYQELLDRALFSASIQAPSRLELEDALTDAYRDFRRAKRLQERAKLSRIR